ncbi:udp-sugar pyrophosphorylase [Anaeramoeba flamelloides]|uniref:Udp-sugar pyrophosphorylase n=1 Tax=Anaeramoeba flamelloides TaxID=1746091 RepID=A0AAV7ZK73_9EUKA|nr:udp-sugar pyrophosphorylase [Anaeramoeba flamelloides]
MQMNKKLFSLFIFCFLILHFISYPFKINCLGDKFEEKKKEKNEPKEIYFEDELISNQYSDFGIITEEPKDHSNLDFESDSNSVNEAEDDEKFDVHKNECIYTREKITVSPGDHSILRSKSKSEGTKKALSRIEVFRSYFERLFGVSAEYIAQAPGRDNGQGEHVDYSKSQFMHREITNLFSFGHAIQYNYLGAISLREDKKIVLIHLDAQESFTIDLDCFSQLQQIAVEERKSSKKEHESTVPIWASHSLGTINAAQEKEGITLQGMSILLSSSVPYGGGLSNSAANCVTLALLLNEAYNSSKEEGGVRLGEDQEIIGMIKLAKWAQSGEHDPFVGGSCGLLDQLISLSGKEGHMALINYGYIVNERILTESPNLGKRAILIVKSQLPQGFKRVLINSMVTHDLQQTEYNDRQKELDLAFDSLHRFHNGDQFTSTGKLTLQDLNDLISILDPDLNLVSLEESLGGERALRLLENELPDEFKENLGYLKNYIASQNKNYLSEDERLNIIEKVKNDYQIPYNKSAKKGSGITFARHQEEGISKERSFAMLLQRMRHQLTSSMRTPLTAIACKRGDVDSFLELIDAEGESLRESGDMKVTGLNGAQDKLLDIGHSVAQEMRTKEGKQIFVAGRMEGGGGGGFDGFYVSTGAKEDETKQKENEKENRNGNGNDIKSEKKHNKFDQDIFQEWLEKVSVQYTNWWNENLSQKTKKKIKYNPSDLTIIISVPSKGASLIDISNTKQTINQNFGDKVDNGAVVAKQHLSKATLEILGKRAPQLLKNIKANVISSQEYLMLIEQIVNTDNVETLNGWEDPGINDHKKRAMLDDLLSVEDDLGENLEEYLKDLQEKLQDAANEKSEFQGYKLEILNGDQEIDLQGKSWDSPEIRNLIRKAIPKANRVAAFSPIGGKGQRLGYNGIKGRIPIDIVSERSFLKHFLISLKSLQDLGNKVNNEKRKNYAFFMTSKDNHDATVQFLKENNNFGFGKAIKEATGKADFFTLSDDEQIVLIPQGLVPSVVDNDAHLSLLNKYKFEMNPHGHGDQNTLAYKFNVPQVFLERGTEYGMFFQDTNAQSVNSMLILLGILQERNAHVVEAGSAKEIGEVVGIYASMVADKEATNPQGELKRDWVGNVEYGAQLDSLLRNSGYNKEPADPSDPTGAISLFRGHLNIRVFNLSAYDEKLRQHKGNFGRFVGPKYKDPSNKHRGGFKKPVRREQMFQDFLKVMDPKKVFVAVFDKRDIFSPVKNDLEGSLCKVADGISSDSMPVAEGHFYQFNRRLVKEAGVDINVRGQIRYAFEGDYEILTIEKPNGVKEKVVLLKEKKIQDLEGSADSENLEEVGNPEEEEEEESMTVTRIKGWERIKLKNGEKDLLNNGRSKIIKRKQIQGIPYQYGSKIVINNVGTPTQVIYMFKGMGGQIDENSVIYVDAPDPSKVDLSGLGDIKGALVIRLSEGQELQIKNGLTVNNKGWEQVPLTLDEIFDPNRRIPQNVFMRGYHLIKHEQMTIDITDWEEGKYAFDFQNGIFIQEKQGSESVLRPIAPFALSYEFKKKLSRSTGIYLSHYTVLDLEDTRLLMLPDSQFKKELITLKVLNDEETSIRGLSEEELYNCAALRITKAGEIQKIDETDPILKAYPLPGNAVAPGVEPNIHKDKTVLITGGSGYIATAVIRDLLHHGSKVIILDRAIREMEEISQLDGVTIIEGDVEDQSLLERIFNEFSIDSIVNLAADIEAGNSMIEPAKFFYNNVIVNALNLYDNAPPTALHTVFASSAGVYGNERGKKRETNNENPQNPYGETKLLMEKVMSAYSKKNNQGVKFVALRFFNVAGAFKWLDRIHGEKHIGRESHLIPILLENIMGRTEEDGQTVRKFSIFGNDYNTPDGTNVRSFIHIQDLANGIIRALARSYVREDNLIANLGAESAMSNLQVFRSAQKVTGIKKEPEFSARRPGDPDSLDADWSFAKEALNWRPLFSDIQRILKDAFQFAEMVKDTPIQAKSEPSPEKTEPGYLLKILHNVDTNKIISNELKFEIMFRIFIDSLYDPSIKEEVKQLHLYQEGKIVRGIQQEIIVSVIQNSQFLKIFSNFKCKDTLKGNALSEIQNYLLDLISEYN